MAEDSITSWPRLVRSEDLLLWSNQLIERLSILGKGIEAKIPTVPTSLPPSGPASGDLGGVYPSPTVVKSSNPNFVVNPGGIGHLGLFGGGAANTGYLAFFDAAGNRSGYFGFGTGGRMGMVMVENGYTGLDFTGSLKQSTFCNPLAQSCWMGGPAQSTVNGLYFVSFPQAHSNPGGLANTTWSRIIAPANSIIILGTSMTITGGAQTVYIVQWDDVATWRKRAGTSGPAGFGCGYSTFAICDTRWGTQFMVQVADSKVSTIVADDTGPWFWAAVLGRAS